MLFVIQHLLCYLSYNTGSCVFTMPNSCVSYPYLYAKFRSESIATMLISEHVVSYYLLLVRAV